MQAYIPDSAVVVTVLLVVLALLSPSQTLIRDKDTT